MKVFQILMLLFFSVGLFAQNEVHIYNPKSDAMQDLKKAIAVAKSQNKHVFVQIGGNWCPWCLMMHKFYTSDTLVDSVMKADYVVVLVNYSRENKNPQVMKWFGYPQRFGFPVIVILDGDSNVLHIQNTAYLEEGRGYNEKKFLEFLKNWNVEALDPKNYE